MELLLLFEIKHQMIKMKYWRMSSLLTTCPTNLDNMNNYLKIALFP